MTESRVSKALQQLEALKHDYVERARTVIATLASRVAQSEDPDLLAEIESELHKLAGSGGSFGFARLSEQARALELKVRALRRGPAEPFAACELAESIGQLADWLNSSPKAAAVPGQGATDVGKRAGGSQHIYLLEPESLEAERIASTLVQFGHQTETFASPESALAAVRQQMPDTVLVDLAIAGGDPQRLAEVFEVLAKMGQRSEFRDCALLILSNEDSLDLRLAAVRAGARGFFVHPVDPIRLIDRLDYLYQQREAPKYRVLVVDDDALLARHNGWVLESGGFEVELVTDPTRTLERMAQFRPDLVLLDLYMPNCSGPELARIIRMHEDWQALPIIYLSAETDHELQLAAASEGADDFLTKPIRDAHLIAAVRSRCERAHQMSMLINRDSLTGLLKHSRIKEELLVEISRSQRQKQPLSVAMLDIDHFKQVNDRYGHPVGDQVIRALANLLRQRMRATDRIGRYGGEEFLAVLPNCDAECSRALLEDICQRFKQLEFTAGEATFRVTLSAGAASNRDFLTAAELLNQADQALYQAKRGGRDQVVLAGPDPAD